MKKHIYALTTAFWFVLLVAVASGCDEQVDPVLGTDQAFTFYGFFNPQGDTQSVRIYPIEGTLERTVAEPLDATVTSTNKETGEVIEWRDSIITFRDGNVGHVFYSKFRADHDTRYTLEAVTRNGRNSYVDIRTPPDGEVEITNLFSARSSVIVEMTYTRTPKILQTASIYTVRVLFPDGTGSTTVRVTIRSSQIEQISDDVWKVTIMPSFDIGSIFTALALRPGRDEVFLDEIEVRAFIASKEWESPIGVFDPELLVQPGTFSNVENGFGFVSGGYYDSFSFQIDDESARNAGFSVE
ncbi:MAG: DUF4249 family protein [Bacteroidetes Order II. Incertae sedis bacterium]|jgi:hypothetical protein|nr:DUF4249 family protein [Bacteroidetes Order II. bacterium]MBT4603409.1 DUF4249 family protein [Bacteroidetes Order II. bacterium]MBT6582275.1 DUF4249 family protein [Bacteroidetes Order II. bacterium]MBT7400121.1 DUF4249 family protein [Bacteroidetes Order II. bacterium]